MAAKKKVGVDEQTWIAPVREAGTTLEGGTAVFKSLAVQLNGL